MADAPALSSYLLISPDANDLPNSRTIQASASSGVILQDGGGGNYLTVNTVGNLNELASYNQPGYISYNPTTRNFVGRTYLSNGTITFTNPDGVDGTTYVNVTPNSSLQQVESALNGLNLSQRSRLNFIPGSNMSIGVTDTADGTDLYFDVVGETHGTVTSVAALPANDSAPFIIGGSPITSEGTLTFDLTDSGVEAGTYFNATVQVDKYGRVVYATDGNSPAGNRVINVTPQMSPYYVQADDYLINVTALDPEVQMEIILPAVVAGNVGKNYIVKDSSGQNTLTLYTHITVQGEFQRAFSIGGTGSMQSSGAPGNITRMEYHAHEVDFVFDVESPFNMTFEDATLDGPQVRIGGLIDNNDYYNISTPYGSLSVVGISDPANTWAIV